LAEDGTNIYSQNRSNGALLPPYVNITTNGTATVVAKSLAGPKTDPNIGAPVPPSPAIIVTTDYPLCRGARLAVEQWIISGNGTYIIGQIDPHADPNQPIYDWVQWRARDIFESAQGGIATVLGSIQSYSIA